MNFVRKTQQWAVKSFGKDYVFYLICILLFVIPFFWFSKHLYVLGEDDTGLMYYNPLGFFRNASSAWFSLDHIGRFEESSGQMMVFSLLLYFGKVLTFGLINLQQLAFGCVISFSFFFVVKILELVTGRKSSVYYIAGLFYAISPNLIITEYYYLLSSTYVIVLGPALVYFLLLSFKSNSYLPLMIGAILSFFLSRAIVTPAFINFFALSTLFFFLYVFFNFSAKKIPYALRCYVLYLLLIVLINSHILIPIIYSFSEHGSSTLTQTIADRTNPAYLQNMIGYIESEIRLNRVVYYLINIFPYPIIRLQGFRDGEFYEKYINNTLPFAFVIPILTFIGLPRVMKRKRKTLLPILIVFFTSLLMMSVNIISLTKQFYYFLMLHTPFFNMNRVPSQKFNIPYTFFYALFVGVSLQAVLRTTLFKHRKVLFLLCFCALFISSFVFITGKLFTQTLPPSYTVRAMDFNENYKELYTDLPKYIHDDARLALFPLGYGFGAFIAGQNNSQYYRSTITGFKSFTGHDLFGNLRVFSTVLNDTFYQKAQKYYFNHDVSEFRYLTKQLNLKYIVFTKNLSFLRQFGEVISEDTYQNPQYYAPAIPGEIVYENDGYKVLKVQDYDSLSQFTLEKRTSELFFNKVSDFMYFAKIKTDSADILKLHEGYSDKWRMYRLSPDSFKCRNAKNYARNYPHISECSHINDNLRGNMMLPALWNLTLAQYPHTKADSFLNSWTIDTEGKYVYVAIIFDGQKYYMLGLFLSSLFLLTYACIVLFKKNARIS